MEGLYFEHKRQSRVQNTTLRSKTVIIDIVETVVRLKDMVDSRLDINFSKIQYPIKFYFSSKPGPRVLGVFLSIPHSFRFTYSLI